jgi:hypothetical protein
MFVTRKTFDLEAGPETISTFDRFTFSTLAKNRINSSFAAPSTGGAATRTFTAPSSSPAICVREARGTTRTPNITAPSFSVISINRQRGFAQLRTKRFNTIDCSTMITMSTSIPERSNIPTGGISL